MSLAKAIKHGKERRKPYRGTKALDATCRVHGSCPYCALGRRHRLRRANLSMKEQLNDHE